GCEEGEWYSYLIASALSEWLYIETMSDGQHFGQEYQQGHPASAPEHLGPADGEGLRVTFLPDPTLFVGVAFDRDHIRDRLREYAYLNSGLRVTFSDAVTGTEDAFEYANGLRAFMQSLIASSHPLHTKPLVARGEAEGMRYEIALQWCEEDDSAERLYVNNKFIPHGGTAVYGLRKAVTRTLNDFIREHQDGRRVLRANQ